MIEGNEELNNKKTRKRGFKKRGRWLIATLAAIVAVAATVLIWGNFIAAGAYGGTWVESGPAGNANSTWRAIALDSDGTHAILGATPGKLYTSTNGGANWTERQPAGAFNRNWYAIASDSDGSNLVAGDGTGRPAEDPLRADGRLYTSSDYGATWTERRPGGINAARTWISAASDADGSNLIAGTFGLNDGRLYTSSDYGATWTERIVPGVDPNGEGSGRNRNWYALASDDDGSSLIAGNATGRLYTSSDYGTTWVERRPAGDTQQYWKSVASNYDGTYLVAGAEDNRLYTSANGGANWTERRPNGDQKWMWRAVSTDTTGANIIVGIYDVNSGGVYISTDYGATWDRQAITGAGVLNRWESVAMSANGSSLLAVDYDGLVYRYVP